MGWWFSKKEEKPEPAPEPAAPAPEPARAPVQVRKPNAALTSRRRLREIFEAEIAFVSQKAPEIVEGFCIFPNGSVMDEYSREMAMSIMRMALADASEAVARQVAPLIKLKKPEILEPAIAQAMFVQIAAPAFAHIEKKLSDRFVPPKEKAAYLNCEALFKSMLSSGFSNSLAGVSGFFRVVSKRLCERDSEILDAYEQVKNSSAPPAGG